MKKIIFIGLIIGLGACKTVEVKQEPELLQMPDKYGTFLINSTNSDFSWETVFQDSSLKFYIHKSLNHNLDIAQAKQQILMNESHILHARGLLLPNLNSFNSFGQRRFGAYTMDGIGNFDTNFSPNLTEDQFIPEHLPDFLIGFQSSWEVDVWSKLRNKKASAVARYLASQEGLTWLMTNIVANTAQIYYELIAIEAELDIINETRILQDRALQIIRLQKSAGKVNELAVNQFEAQLLNFNAMAVQREMDKKLLQNAFFNVMGVYPQPLTVSSREVLEQDLEITLFSPKELIEKRPDIKAAEYELMAHRHDVLSAKAAFYPKLELNALMGFQTFNPSFILSPQSLTYSLFGNLSAPLLNRKALMAEFDYTSSGKMKAFYQYQQSLLEAYFEVFNQTITIDTLEEIIELKERESNVMASALENSNELFLSGNANYLEIVVARTNLLQSQLELIHANRDQKIAYINLYRSLGGG